MSGAPPVPFLLTQPTRFAATFQTTNADAAIGDGTFSAMWWIVGHMLHIQAVFAMGTTTSLGTGSLLAPLPPGLTPADVDTAAMPLVAGAFVVPGQAAGNVNAVPIKNDTLIVMVPGTITVADIIAGLAAAVPGDVVAFRYSLPLIEPGIPR